MTIPGHTTTFLSAAKSMFLRKAALQRVLQGSNNPTWILPHVTRCRLLQQFRQHLSLCYWKTTETANSTKKSVFQCESSPKYIQRTSRSPLIWHTTTPALISLLSPQNPLPYPFLSLTATEGREPSRHPALRSPSHPAPAVAHHPRTVAQGAPVPTMLTPPHRAPYLPWRTTTVRRPWLLLASPARLGSARLGAARPGPRPNSRLRPRAAPAAGPHCRAAPLGPWGGRRARPNPPPPVPTAPGPAGPRPTLPQRGAAASPSRPATWLRGFPGGKGGWPVAARSGPRHLRRLTERPVPPLPAAAGPGPGGPTGEAGERQPTALARARAEAGGQGLARRLALRAPAAERRSPKGRVLRIP